MSFFQGFIAEGTGGPAGFAENTATGYARQAVTFSGLANGNVSLAAPVQFPVSANTTVTQRALYDASTGGNLIMWWQLVNPVTVLAGGFDSIKSGSLAHCFPDLYNGIGQGTQGVDFPVGRKIGVTMDGNPIYAGHYLEVANGTVAAKSTV